MPISINRTMLAIGTSTPFLYFAALFIAGLFYPDYSHVRQVASDLGAVGAPYDLANLFNVGLILTGLAGCLGAIGLFGGLMRTSSGIPLALATGLTVFAPSLTVVMSGAFPMPSPYHSNIFLLMAGIFAPLFGAFAIRELPNTQLIRRYLLLAFVAGLLLVPILFGIGGLLTEDNVGLWLRIWAGVSLPPVGVLCWVVRQRA